MDKLALATFALLLLCACERVDPVKPLPGPQLVLDESFGDAGQVRTPLLQNSEIYAAALQPDGKLVVAGSVSQSGGDALFGLARYLPNGSLDTGFGDNGSVLTQLQSTDGSNRLAVPYFLVLQGDKIVVGGLRDVHELDETYEPRLVVVRYTAGGELDAGFAEEGFFELPSPTGSAAYDALLQPDGKLVVVGRLGDYALVLRLTSEGVLDPKFGANGLRSYPSLEGEVSSLVRTQSGNYLIATDSMLARLEQDGALDTSFAGLEFEYPGRPQLASQEDGSILLASSKERTYGARLSPQTSPPLLTDIVVRRLSAEGVPDPDFGRDGVAVIDVGGAGALSDIVVQPDGHLTLTGSYGFSALRLTPEGALDASYIGALESSEVALVTPENTVIIAGYALSRSGRNFALAKFLRDARIGD